MKNGKFKEPRSIFFAQKNNYVGGNIVNLPIGNTEVIAKKIQRLMGSDLFKINTVLASFW